MRSPNAKPKLEYTGKLNVPTYSDADLRTVDFFTADPLSGGRLSVTPPRLDEDLTLVSNYEAAEELLCAFGHKHKRGFLLEGEDGQRHLIGCDCAHTRYGLEWEEFQGKFDDLAARKKSLTWLHDVASAIIGVEAELRSLPQHRSVIAFDQLRKDLRSLPVAVYRVFREGSTNPTSSLLGTFQERDLYSERLNIRMAERALDDATERKAAAPEINSLVKKLKEAKQPVFHNVKKAMLKNPAKSLFTPNSGMAKRLSEQVGRIVGLAYNLNGPKRFPYPDQIAGAIIRRAVELDETLAELDGVVALFAPSTLASLETLFKALEFRWINVTRIAGGFDFDEAGKRYSFVKPQELRSIPLALAAKLRKPT